MVRCFIAVAIICLNFTVLGTVSHAAPFVKDIRIGAHADYTRFVVELSERVPYRLLTLADPLRIVVDLPEVAWTESAGKGLTKTQGFVDGYRSGLFRPGVSRIVIDLTQPVEIKRHFRLDAADGSNNRLVIDMVPTTASAFTAALGETPSQDWVSYAKALGGRKPAFVAAAPGDTPKPDEEPRRIVVIDPGHGGVDPGAIGASGAYEKRIVLQFSRKLRDVLQKSGRYQAVLTRDRDVYLPLRDRYEVAHVNEADLFISVHADSHGSSKTRGFSVYTLSEKASDKEAAALAAKENKSDILAGYDLSGYDDQTTFILLDLAQRKTSEASWQFARSVVDRVGTKVPLLRRPHRFAGFAVLKSPTVPSVLVELGYMSNRSEEKLLKTETHQNKIASGMLEAIDTFFEKQDRLNRS